MTRPIEVRVPKMQAKITCAVIEAMGMEAANMQRYAGGESMTYTEQDFLNVIHNNGITQEQVDKYLEK